MSISGCQCSRRNRDVHLFSVSHNTSFVSSTLNVTRIVIQYSDSELNLVITCYKLYIIIYIYIYILYIYIYTIIHNIKIHGAIVLIDSWKRSVI